MNDFLKSSTIQKSSYWGPTIYESILLQSLKLPAEIKNTSCENSTKVSSTKWCCRTSEQDFGWSSKINALGFKFTRNFLGWSTLDCSLHTQPKSYICPKIITSYEALNERKPSVTHLRTFGCMSYAHVPGDERDKLDSKLNCCVIFGFGSDKMVSSLQPG